MFDDIQLGEPYRIGRLTYIPIMLAPPSKSYGFWGDINLERDVHYGSQTWHGPGLCILPAATVLWMDNAQDRCVPAAHVFRNEITVQTFCLDPHNGGLGGSYRKGMLPLPMRVAAMQNAGKGSFNAIWDEIKAQNTRLALSDDNARALSVLLTDFAAMHLMVPPAEARGMLVMLDSVPMGIEIAPSAAAFQTWWNGADGLNMSYATDPAQLAPQAQLTGGSSALTLAEAFFGHDVIVMDDADGVEHITMGPFEGFVVNDGGPLAYASLINVRASEALHG